MRTVILEEHFSLPAASARVDKAVIARRGYKARALRKDVPNPLALLPDLGEQRLQSMDEAGITVEVLSNSGPGPDLVPGPDGVAMAREINDHLGAALRQISRSLCRLCLVADAKPRCRGQGIGAHREGAWLRRRHGQRHDRRKIPRRSELRRHPCGGGRTRRADLHPSAHSAGCRPRSLFLRPARRRRPRAGNRRLGLAFRSRRARAAHGGRG